jgi:hypothetical protein
MDGALIERLIELGNRAGSFFIATADKNGMPHMASARRAERISENRFAVTEWFCPGTVANLRENPRLSVVAWDSESDVGYQVIGQAEDIHDEAMLDGYEAGRFEENPMPQVERRLVVRSEAVLEFRQQPHSDAPVR